MAAAVDIPSPGNSPREQDDDIDGNLFSPANDIEVDASPLTSKVVIPPAVYKNSPVCKFLCLTLFQGN